MLNFTNKYRYLYLYLHYKYEKVLNMQHDFNIDQNILKRYIYIRLK